MAPLHPPALRCPPHSREAGAHGFRVRSESAPSRLERPVQGLRCCCGTRCCSLGKNLSAIRTRKESYKRLGQTKNLSAARAGKDRPRIRLHTTPPPPPPRRLRRPGRGGEGGGGSPDCRFTARHSHRRDAAVRRPRGAPRWRSKRRRLQRACLRARRRQRACMRADEVC